MSTRALEPASPPEDRSAEDLLALPDRLWDLLPVAAYVCDRDGAIVRFNRRATELWGRAPAPGDRFCGSLRLYRLDGRPLPHATCPMADILRTGVPLRDQEIVMERPDGSRIVALARIDPIRDQSGTVIGAINCFDDVTGRTREQALLAGQKQILQMVASGAPLDDTLAELTRFIEAQEDGVRCGILILAEDGAHFQRGVGPSLPETYHRALAGVPIVPPYLGPCGQSAHQNTAVTVPDIAADSRWADEWRTMVLSCGLASCRSIPVLGQDGRVLGAFAMYYDRPCDPHPAYPELVEIAAHLAGIAIERERRQASLRASEERLATELAATRQLQETSTLLIQEGDIDALYRRLLDAATALMHADMASIQMLHPQRGELRLLAWTGFHPDSAAFWEWVRLDSGSSCGAALSTDRRIVVPDVETCDFMAGTADLEFYRLSGIRAVQSTPLVSRSGAILGMISTHWRAPHEPSERALDMLDMLARQAADLIERSRSEQAAQRLAAIVESSDDAIVSKDLDGIIVTWNAGAERLFGYSADEAIGRSVTILIPPDRHDEEPEILARIRRGDCIDRYETVRRRKDGTLIDISLTVSPVRDGAGKIVGASKIARDITERKRAQEQQTLLIREMSHRIKNLFAVTNAVMALSARSARTPQDMAAAVRDRLQALTRAQDLTRPGLIDPCTTSNPGATLHALVRTVFSPYVDPQPSGAPECVILEGCDVPVGGKAVASLALVLHELATNATKYGALSSPRGVVRLDCSAEGGELSLTWREQGGPPLDGPPAEEGFGGLLVRRIVTGQFGGRLTQDWNPDGLVVRLSMPVDRLAS